MKLPREDRYADIEPFLPLVEKPSRYLDHEWGAVEDQPGPFHACMIYPDAYEVGQPNLGVAILYNELNKAEGISCERSYLPWPDMADLMRRNGVPMLSLETSSPIASFEVVGFTMAFEMACTNIMEALDLSRIPVRAEDRAEDDAIVLGGGPSVWNCEPMAPMFDAILLGDGEEAIVEMCHCVRDGRAAGLSRLDILRNLGRIQGVYVPRLYDIVVDETSTEWGYAVPKAGEDVPARVLKRCVGDFAATDPLCEKIVPYMGLVQEGMTYRPVRERPASQVIGAVEQGLATTGYDECSLSSLSTTDHSQCAEMLNGLKEELSAKGIKVSIPSQRLDSFGVDMAAAVGASRKTGLTFAPEAGTQRLRDVINKNVTDEDIDTAARNAFANGWRRMKLYFMMGLPTETDEDILGIPQTAERVVQIGREMLGPRSGVSVSISVAVFVPKAHTPFQWAPQLELGEVTRRQQLLLHATKDRAIRVSYHSAQTSVVEAALSKMGRRGFDLIAGAWRRGCRFDAWTDQFHYEWWEEAARDLGLSLEDIASTTFSVDARLPWEHTSPGVSQGYLKREWRRAAQGVTTPDCTRTSCTGCGVCPTLGVDNVIVGERA